MHLKLISSEHFGSILKIPLCNYMGTKSLSISAGTSSFKEQAQTGVQDHTYNYYRDAGKVFKPYLCLCSQARCNSISISLCEHLSDAKLTHKIHSFLDVLEAGNGLLG